MLLLVLEQILPKKALENRPRQQGWGGGTTYTALEIVKVERATGLEPLALVGPEQAVVRATALLTKLLLDVAADFLDGHVALELRQHGVSVLCCAGCALP